MINLTINSKKHILFCKHNYLKIEIKTPKTRQLPIVLKSVKTKTNLLTTENIYTSFFKNYTYTEKKSLTNSWLWSKGFMNLVHQYTLYKTEWLFLNVSTLIKNGKFYVIWYKCYRKYKIRALYVQKNQFIIWFTQLTFFKDVRGVLPLFQKILINTHLKKHKKIFFIIRNFFKIWLNWSKKHQNVKGFSLFFKGKLGRKGSVKKMKFFSKQGLISYTNKQLRVNYENYIVWTHTGVVGCGISIFF